MEYFRDKIAIVTGSASGIGRAISEELCRRGASVIVADINKKGADETVRLISEKGGTARAVHLDVTVQEDVEQLIKDTAAEHGRLDFMFNNAGIAFAGEVRDLSQEHWDKTIGVNLMGVLYGTTAAYSVMVRQGFGHIVNTASGAGLFPFPTSAPYALTKFGVVGLTTSLRAEGAGLGVKVSVICPGLVESGIYEASPVINADREAFYKDFRAGKIMPTSKAAEAILNAVARNRGIIVVPFQYRVIWWLYRLNPAILDLLFRQTVKKFREVRYDS